jgi:predicted methyltransferase
VLSLHGRPSIDFLARCKGPVVVLLFIGFAPLMSFAGGANPDINQPYLDPDYTLWVERFERPGREVYDHRHEIIAALRLSPGQSVADIGAGTGFFSRLMAQHVTPKGKVYAVDISAVFIDNIMRYAREQRLSQIQGIVNTQRDSKLPAQSIDLAFLCDTYHHFEYPQVMLASIRRALKPGGSLVVIDFQRIEGESSDWVLQHVRAGKELVIQEVESAGFRLSEDRPMLKTNYYLRFRRTQ